MKNETFKKILIISSSVFIISFILLTQLYSKLDDFNYFYYDNIFKSDYSLADNSQKQEKSHYYDIFSQKANYIGYESIEEMKEAIGENADADAIISFDFDNALKNMTEVTDIKITESNYDDENQNKVKIYTDKDSNTFTVLKSCNNYQFYNSYRQRPEKYAGFIEDNENNHSLIYANSLWGDNECRLYFSNLEMNIINGGSNNIIYNPNYSDVSFECEKLPVKIAYGIKDNSITKTDIFCITNNGKDPEDYTFDSSLFYDENTSELFKKAIYEKKSFKENGFKVSYKGKFNMGHNYYCYLVSVEKKQ